MIAPRDGRSVMKNSFIIFVVAASLFEAGCASNPSGSSQTALGGGTADNQQEQVLGGRTSRVNMQIGPAECTVR